MPRLSAPRRRDCPPRPSPAARSPRGPSSSLLAYFAAVPAAALRCLSPDRGPGQAPRAVSSRRRGPTAAALRAGAGIALLLLATLTALPAQAQDVTPPGMRVLNSSVLAAGTPIELAFDEHLDQSNRPLASAFTVNADGSPVTVGSLDGFNVGSFGVIRLTVSPVIRRGQVVTVSYTDPTSGNDDNAVQDAAGNDAASFENVVVRNNSIDTTGLPGAPTGLSATKMGSAQIDLSWTEPADPGDAVITGYRIEVSDAGATGPWTELITDTGNTDTTYSDTGLTPETTRHYRVSARNSFGHGPASNVDFATTDDIVAPVLVLVRTTTSGQSLIIEGHA